MILWYLDNHGRLKKEHEEISALGRDVDWITGIEWTFEEAQLCIDVDMEVHSNIYSGRLRYPATYPFCPPAVRPKDATERWSLHQYGPGGTLCLEWGPDNWHPDITAADILRSAYRLLHAENPLGKIKTSVVPSRHALTVWQELRGEYCRFIITETLKDYLCSLPDTVSGSVSAYMIFEKKCVKAIINTITADGGDPWKDSSLPQFLEKKSSEWKGVFIKTPLVPNFLDIKNIIELSKLLESKGSEEIIHRIKNKKPDEILLLISDEKSKPRLFFFAEGEQELIGFNGIRVNGQNTGDRQFPEFEALTDKRVGIVGLGSAGSKIAISVGRSGVRKFLLIDDDIFMPENICRHTLNWSNVGTHKAEAIADQLSLIAPRMTVDTRTIRLTGQESARDVAYALEKIGDCDLIIDATADPETFNQLSSVATQYQKPFVWLEVFAGGVGGLLARYIPSHTPDPHTMRQAFLRAIEEKGIPDNSKTDNYAREDEEGKIIVASDADVSVISSHAVQMSIDALLNREPSHFPYSMYLIGLSKGWIFREPFHTIPVDVGVPSDNTDTDVYSREESAEGLKFLCSILKK
jgi:molybdopterin/thiamine biosynthesis adenylyltransferase/ubiquitin-protein ligase